MRMRRAGFKPARENSSLSLRRWGGGGSLSLSGGQRGNFLGGSGGSGGGHVPKGLPGGWGIGEKEE